MLVIQQINVSDIYSKILNPLYFFLSFSTWYAITKRASSSDSLPAARRNTVSESADGHPVLRGNWQTVHLRPARCSKRYSCHRQICGHRQ
nr:MAG TPA: hypothetical protein [Caudoviricetes sp.]